MYGHPAIAEARCAEQPCPIPAQIADDDDPTVLRCVPHAMSRLRGAAVVPARC